jgi:hypothetical protein
MEIGRSGTSFARSVSCSRRSQYCRLIRAGTEGARIDQVCRAPNGGAPTRKFVSGIADLSKLEIAEAMRTAEKRVTFARSINPGGFLSHAADDVRGSVE